MIEIQNFPTAWTKCLCRRKDSYQIIYKAE